MNLYVSNLSYDITDPQLQEAFAAYGAVASARVINDRETGRSRGFGFVEMPNDDEARAAIRALDNQDLGGRPLKVVEARPKEEKPGGPPRRPFNGGGGAPSGPRRDGGGGGGRRDGGGGGGGGGRGDWDRDRDRDRGRDRDSHRGRGRRGGESDGDDW